MKKMDFASLLNKIHSEVETMRGIVRKVDEEGRTSVTGMEIFHSPQRDLQLCFLIFLAYTKSFEGDFPEDTCDMEILLNKHFSNSQTVVFDLWNSIKKEMHESFSKWMQLIKSLSLHNYRTPENDKILLQWANESLLFNEGVMSEFTLHVKLLLEVIDHTSNTLDLNLSNNKLLVIGDNDYYYKKIFTGKLNYSSYTLCPEGDYLNSCSLLNTFFFLGNEKYHIIKRDKNSKEIFPFEEARFDTIYSFVEKDNDSLDFKKILSLTDKGGCGIIFGQPQKEIIDKSTFLNADFPLIADYVSATYAENLNKLYVYKQGSTKNSKVRAVEAFYSSDDINVHYNGFLKGLVNCISNSSNAYNYQELTKEDFLYAPAGDVQLSKVFRDTDQMDFVFRKIDDILRLKSNHNIPVNEVPQETIINRLSADPFNISLSPKYLLDNDIYNDDFSKEIAEKAFIVEKNNNYCLLDPQFYDEKYYKIAETIAWGGEGPDKERTQLECRIMTESGLLWNGSKSFLRVKCSKVHPICYRYCIFCQDDYHPQCQTYINEIEISEDYDEDFVIYQFANHFSFNTDYILMAPTKEKQHEYYLKKKDEYRLKNADLIKEIREEDRKALSVDLHYLKHDAAQYLSSINATAQNFKMMLQKGPLALNDSMGADYTIEDALDNISKSVSHVTEFLKQMTLLTDTVPKRKMNIADLLRSFVSGSLKRDYYKICLSLSDNIENVFCLLDDRINKVFANILSNAERHAFTDFNRCDYELRINAYRENDMVIISFANNGNPPDSTLTEEGYFTRGLHVGKTGHNGFGGSIIRDTINAQDGIVHLQLNKDKKYPFIIEIKLKIEND